MLNLISRPNLVSAVFNPILFKFSAGGYTIGDLFYLEIYRENNTLLTTLTKNGSGTGTATFDISYSLQTLFTEVKDLDSTLFVQNDPTAMKGYKVKAGIQKMVNGAPVRTRYYMTDLMYALRAALPLDGSDSIDNYILTTSRQTKFLTANRGEQPDGSNIYLPVVVTTPLDALAKAQEPQIDSIESTTPLSLEPGLVVFNAKPELVGLPGKKVFNFWLELETTGQIFYSTKDYTKNCLNSLEILLLL